MNRRLLTMMALLAAFAASAVAQVTDWRDIPTPPLRKFDVQQPKRIQLPNGLVVFLQQDRELPLVSGTAIIRGGSREVPASKTGLMSIYGQVWRTGGTTARTGDELDDFLEARAARVETGADDDSTSISFNTLKGELDAVYGIWVDLLRNPAFRDEKIELARRQLNTGIARRNDSPGAIASRESAKLLWGADSPYARHAEYDTVAAVNQEDLLAWHARSVHPNNMIIGIAGDFDPKAMEARLRKTFANWKRGPQAVAPDIAPQPARGVYFVPKDDVTQSTIVLIHPGARKDDPDYHAIQILNEVFAGGFSGRLLNRIRTQKGLAYTVSGGIGTGYDRLGAFQVSMGTKSASTVEAIEALYAEIADIRDNLVSPEELAFAKESILNSWVFLLDTKEKILNQRMTLEFYGYPADFLERYRAGLDRVGVEDLKRIANEFIDPDRLAVLVVGKESDLQPPLSTLGAVQVLDITIPEPGASAPPPPPSTGDQASGTRLFRTMVEFLGGPAIDSIRTTRSVAEVQANSPAGPMDVRQTVTVDWLNVRVHRDVNTPMGAMQMVLAGNEAFVRTPVGVQDLPASQKTAILSELWLDPLWLARHADDPAVHISAAGSGMVGDISAEKLEIDAAGSRFTLWIDPATGRPLRRTRTSMAMGQQTEEIRDFGEWKTTSGIRYAAGFVVTANGEKQADVAVTEFEVNPTLDEALFARE